MSAGDPTASHGKGRVRRSTRKLFGLSEQQDHNLVELLKGQVGYRGGWTTLRNSLAEYATANGMQCSFAYEWRRAFLQRHGPSLPPVINALFSLSLEHNDSMLDGSSSVPLHEQVSQLTGVPANDEEDVGEVGGAAKDGRVEVSLSEQPAEWDADMRQAIQQAMTAFVKAGINEVKARRTLARMGVPGFVIFEKSAKSKENRKKKRRREGSTKDEEFRVVQAPSRKEGSPRVSGSQSASSVTENATLPEGSPSKTTTLSSSKKTPLQLRVLEREYLKNRHLTSARAAQLAGKLLLESEQVMAWFRGKRGREKARRATTGS
ncbi:hypothetical protein RvY_17304 [Ramazzottius varieornatus]|uniref:Homeobox domain-containing protein n=1 Tax=Ramazzottius varieornatus TaxID=947166 RepID=A0A1D1W1N2_RAMVA|nr:hypothetical protein RvY_17304 [Ramazzottius varieornatus]